MIRTIKPEFWQDEKVGKMSIHARMLFIGMWNFADDFGVVRGHPVFLRSQIFPYDDFTKMDIESWVDEIANQGMITVFVSKSENFYQINNFLKHQVINKPSKFNRNPQLIDSVIMDGSVNTTVGLPTEVGVGITNTPLPPSKSRGGSESEKISSNEKQSTDTSTSTNLEQLPVIEKQLKPTRGMTTKLQTLFDRFCLAYPKRIAKAVAASAWVKIAPDDQLAAVIIAAIDQAKNADSWKREGGRFIPNPATWLNGQCWQDEHQISTSSLPNAVMPKRTYVDATVDLYADSRQNRTPEGLVPITPYAQP